MAAITGVDVALRNQVNRELWDYADDYHSFVSVLAALDNMWQVQSRFQKDNDTTGESFQFTYRKGLPTVQGVLARTDTITNLPRTEQSNFSIVAGKIQPSFYDSREDVRRAYLSVFEKNPQAVVPYLKAVAQAMRDAFYKKLSDDMFPTDIGEPTDPGSGTSYAEAEDKVMAVHYPLQSGYADNEASGSGTYSYLGFDLNAAGYTGLKSVQKGTTTAGFGNPTWDNIRTNLILPLKLRGAKPDLLLVDSGTYSYMLNDAETAIRLSQSTNLKFGGEIIRVGDMFVMPESRLDTLGVSYPRQLYCLQTDTWRFKYRHLNDQLKFIDHPDTAVLVTLLAYIEVCLVCEHPRFNGRGYNVSLA